MAIPENALKRIDKYTLILITRFPPSSDFYLLSVGHPKERDAISDTTPAESIFTLDDLQPVGDSRVYTDSAKTTTLDGGNLLYHVFDKSSTDLRYIIQVTHEGVVSNIYEII